MKRWSSSAAAEDGGNCELTEPGSQVFHGVHVLGYTDLPSRLPTQSSRLYGNNLVKLVNLLGPADEFSIDQEDEVIRGTLVRQRQAFLASAQGRGQPATGQTQGGSGTGSRGQGIRRLIDLFSGLMLGLFGYCSVGLGMEG